MKRITSFSNLMRIEVPKGSEVHVVARFGDYLNWNLKKNIIPFERRNRSGFISHLEIANKVRRDFSHLLLGTFHLAVNKTLQSAEIIDGVGRTEGSLKRLEDKNFGQKDLDTPIALTLCNYEDKLEVYFSLNSSS